VSPLTTCTPPSHSKSIQQGSEAIISLDAVPRNPAEASTLINACLSQFGVQYQLYYHEELPPANYAFTMTRLALVPKKHHALDDKGYFHVHKDGVALQILCGLVTKFNRMSKLQVTLRASLDFSAPRYTNFLRISVEPDTTNNRKISRAMIVKQHRLYQDLLNLMAINVKYSHLNTDVHFLLQQYHNKLEYEHKLLTSYFKTKDQLLKCTELLEKYRDGKVNHDEVQDKLDLIVPESINKDKVLQLIDDATFFLGEVDNYILENDQQDFQLLPIETPPSKT